LAGLAKMLVAEICVNDMEAGVALKNTVEECRVKLHILRFLFFAFI